MNYTLINVRAKQYYICTSVKYNIICFILSNIKLNKHAVLVLYF